MAKRKSKKRTKGYLLPKYQTKGRVIPTRADSLFLLGNNQIIDNFIQKGATWSHIEEPAEDWETEYNNLVADLKDFVPTEIENYKESVKQPQEFREYYESKHGTKKGEVEDYIDEKGKFTGAKDWISGGKEDIDFPFQYLHPQIRPTFSGDLRFDNRDIYSYGYKDLAITPWDMIPEDKQEERVKKYGTSGVPDSYLNPKPVPITRTTYKFEQRDSKNTDTFDYYTEETKDGKVKYFKKRKNTFQNGGQIPKYQTEGKVYSGGMLPEVIVQPDQIKYNWNDPMLDDSSSYNQRKRNEEVENFARQLFAEQRGSFEDRMQEYRDDPTNPLAYTPDADFSSIGYHLDKGNYGDAALYSLFAALPRCSLVKQ